MDLLTRFILMVVLMIIAAALLTIAIFVAKTVSRGCVNKEYKKRGTVIVLSLIILATGVIAWISLILQF